MSNIPRKRRRPRRRPGAGKASATTSETKKEEAPAAKARTRKPRRRRRSRKKVPPQATIRKDDSLQVHHYRSEDVQVQPLNRHVFIYTYTLRPRHYLDNYQAKSSIAERMAFEGPDQESVKDSRA